MFLIFLCFCRLLFLFALSLSTYRSSETEKGKSFRRLLVSWLTLDNIGCTFWLFPLNFNMSPVAGFSFCALCNSLWCIVYRKPWWDSSAHELVMSESWVVMRVAIQATSFFLAIWRPSQVARTALTDISTEHWGHIPFYVPSTKRERESQNLYFPFMVYNWCQIGNQTILPPNGGPQHWAWQCSSHRSGGNYQCRPWSEAHKTDNPGISHI